MARTRPMDRFWAPQKAAMLAIGRPRVNGMDVPRGTKERNAREMSHLTVWPVAGLPPALPVGAPSDDEQGWKGRSSTAALESDPAPASPWLQSRFDPLQSSG